MSKTFPYAYIRKKIHQTKDATIPIQSKAVQYGIGCFSGIRGNWNAKQKNLYLFRLEDHYIRLSEAAIILGMNFKMSYPQFKKIIFDLIKKNQAKEDIYLRPTLYASSTLLTPRFDSEGDDLAVYMMSLKKYFKGNGGLNVCTSSWRRYDDDMFSVKAKITGSYANSALAKTEAVKNGYDEPIFLNRDGKVCEASGANIFGIKNGKIWTPPLSSNILNGITRRCVIELARKELNLEVREENFDRSMLYTFQECFLTGTAAKITPIRSVDKRLLNNGKLGKITQKIQEIYDKAAMNENKDYEKWCQAVW